MIKHFEFHELCKASSLLQSNFLSIELKIFYNLASNIFLFLFPTKSLQPHTIYFRVNSTVFKCPGTLWFGSSYPFSLEYPSLLHFSYCPFSLPLFFLLYHIWMLKLTFFSLINAKASMKNSIDYSWSQLPCILLSSCYILFMPLVCWILFIPGIIVINIYTAPSRLLCFWRKS